MSPQYPHSGCSTCRLLEVTLQQAAFWTSPGQFPPTPKREKRSKAKHMAAPFSLPPTSDLKPKHHVACFCPHGASVPLTTPITWLNCSAGAEMRCLSWGNQAKGIRVLGRILVRVSLPLWEWTPFQIQASTFRPVAKIPALTEMCSVQIF